MTIFEKFKLRGKRDAFVVAVACPHDFETLNTLKQAFDKEIITKAILCGEEERINEVLTTFHLSLPNYEVHNCLTMEEAANQVAQLVSDDEADAPMKGLIDTSKFLKAMLNKELNIRVGTQLSHVMLIHRLEDDLDYIVADGGMNILPSLEEKIDIIKSSVKLANSLGIDNPVVVPLTAKEKVYDRMPATVDAGKLREMNINGEINGCQISGPLQFDLAISAESAKIKNVKDPLAGKADILIVPNIESGNIFVKALTYLAGFTGYGLILGARVPMIVVSRSDGEEEKLGSIYLARLITEKEKENV